MAENIRLAAWGQGWRSWLQKDQGNFWGMMKTFYILIEETVPQLHTFTKINRLDTVKQMHSTVYWLYLNSVDFKRKYRLKKFSCFKVLKFSSGFQVESTLASPLRLVQTHTLGPIPGMSDSVAQAEAWEVASLSSQVMLMFLVQGPHFENPC